MASSVRSRTIRHLRKIVATSAMGGAAFMAGCDSSSSTKESAVVCDPLPPAVTCSKDLDRDELYNASSITAWWVTGGLPFIHLNFTFYDHPDQLSFSADPIVTGGSTGKLVRDTRSVTVEIVPDKRVTEITVDFPISCDGIASTVGVTLDSVPPKSGEAVAWSWSE